jgi:DNA-binding IclR family transcriptional regulator
MNVSISKSVARAFEVIELFRVIRKPATATELRRRLNYPHSSMVAVLHNLADLGYLSYDSSTRLYFPTTKLSSMATWVQPILKGSGRLGELVATVAADAGHTATISCRNSLFLNIVHVRKGSSPHACECPSGVGITLCRSTPGLAIVSQMTDPEIEKLVAQTARWATHAKADQARPLTEVMAQVEEIRRGEAAIGYDCALVGVGAIAYPLHSPFEKMPLAISVTGETHRIKANAARIRAVLEYYLGQHAAGGTEIWKRFVPAKDEQRYVPKRCVPAKPIIPAATPNPSSFGTVRLH